MSRRYTTTVAVKVYVWETLRYYALIFIFPSFSASL